MKIELIIDQQPFEIKSTCTVSKEGTLSYKCELLGSTISTFRYGTNYESNTQEEAIKAIAFELRRALDELADY